MQGGIGVIVALFVVMAGCGARSGPSETTVQMKQFSESMCGCTDVACAEQVDKQLAVWAESAHAQPTREERDLNAKYTLQYETCKREHMTAATPAAGSAAPVPASAPKQ